MPKANKKLHNLLNTFSPDEMKEFKKLIVSPLFTTRKNYIPILNEIARSRRKEGVNLSSHELYSKLFPGKKFNAQTLKNRYSELLKLAEEYIIYKHLEKNKIEKEKILLLEYLDKKLFTLFDSKYKRTKRFVESLPDNDEKFRNISFLNVVNLSLLNKKSRRSTMYKQYYEQSKYSLYVYLIELFQRGAEFALQEYDNVRIENNIITEILKLPRLENLIRSISLSDSKISKIVLMHYYLYKAYEDPSGEENYFRMRKIFSEHNSFFSPEYKDEIYKSMISYCIIRQNSGEKKFQFELFKLYNEKLEQGLYSEFKVNMFPVNTFRDYVYIGIEIKKYKWVENFIKKYSSELPDEIRDDETNLSFAKLYFANLQYGKSLELLNKVKGGNYLHYISCAVFKLCCYFELNKIEDAFFQIDNFRHYIRNHKEIPKIHLVPATNFIKLYQKFLNISTQPGKHDTGFLEKEIKSLKSISKREWLLEKVSQ